MKLFYQICKLVFYIIFIILILEFFFGIYRNFRRQTTYQKAVKRSKQINKPLIVIGSPDAGFMNSIYSVYGCGDVCVDLVGCKACKISIKGNVIDVLKKSRWRPARNGRHKVGVPVTMEFAFSLTAD